MTILENVPLNNLHTFQTSGSAQYFTSIASIPQLQEAILWAKNKSIPFLILGQGSNILFSKDFKGLIIKNQIHHIHTIQESTNHTTFKVGAGNHWDDFVQFAISKNLQGIENLSGIPGTVGAAPIQNIGAYGSEIKSVISSIEYLDIPTFQIKNIQHQDCLFAYRTSIFKQSLKNQAVITSVNFQLQKPPFILQLQYKELLQHFQNKTSPSLQQIRDFILFIRNAKLPPLDTYGNAGSFFKNPIISNNTFIQLKNKFPDIPFYTENTHQTKIPAAWLIEKTGWKGKTIGNIGTYQNQALIIINTSKNTKGIDIIEFANNIKKSVRDTFQIELENEVNII